MSPLFYYKQKKMGIAIYVCITVVRHNIIKSAPLTITISRAFVFSMAIFLSSSRIFPFGLCLISAISVRITAFYAANGDRNPGAGTSGTDAPIYPAGLPCLRTASIGNC